MEKKSNLIESLSNNQKTFEQVHEQYSEAQKTWKPTPESWSINENLEHLAHTEKSFHHVLLWTLQQPSTNSEAVGHRMSDEKLKYFLADRSRKIQAPDRLNPTGEISTAEVLAKFLEFRQKTKATVAATDADMELHFWQHPFLGILNAHQVVVNTCEHAKRHFSQIEAIASTEGFPS